MYRYGVMLPFVVMVAVMGSVIVLFTFTEVSQANSSGPPSQGSVSEGPDFTAKSYSGFSTVVDNSHGKRFAAPGWRAPSAKPGRHGEDYRAARPVRDDEEARFRAKIPATGTYTVYAWWPADKDNNPAARFGVKTGSGLEWTEVDQRRDGGYWVQIGEYRLKAGEHARNYVRVASNSNKPGRVVADAVAIVRGAQVNPPDDSRESGYSLSENGDGGTELSSNRSKGREVVREARRHKGTRYGHSSCRIGVREDCSCHTDLVFEKFGRSLPDSPQKQYSNYGWRVAKSDLRQGDLVFFREFGRDEPVTHVAIYSGNGYIVHASNYYGRVVESEMKWIKGYAGAKRLKLR